MPSCVTGYGVNLSKVEFGHGSEKINPKDMLSAGDILIARGNKRDQVGNCGVVPPEAEGWVCANLLMRMRLKYNIADPNFCIYWLRSPTMRKHIAASMTGTNPNIQKINQKKIMDFPYPANVHVSEQRRIVAELDQIQAQVDSLKRLQEATAAELQALLPSILDRAFKGEL
jgi:type I restriction enzyme S subunit